MNSQPLHMTDELLVKYMLNECSTDEQRQVEAWLQEDEANQSYYQHFQLIWQSSSSLVSDSNIDPQASWQRLKPKLTTPASSWKLHRYLYYAAAVIVLLLGIWMLFKPHSSQRIPQEEIAHKDTTFHRIPSVQKIHFASASQPKIDTLSDRSIVTLNRHATLIHPKEFHGNERRVQLEGEAFFSIAPDKKKPFFIETGDHVEIRVVGTSFNVKTTNDYTEVIVETGIVEVRHFNKLLILHQHERAKIKKNDSTVHVEKNKDKLYRYYRDRQFECENTPLWKFVEILNEAYDDSVTIENKALRSEVLTTRFDNESLSQILSIISETFDITVEKQGHHYILK